MSDLSGAGPARPVSLPRRFLPPVLWMGSAEGAARLGNAVLQILLVRAMPPARYGVFAYAYSLFLVVVALMSLGVAEAFIREGSIRRERLGSVLAEFFSLRVLSAGATTAVVAAVALASRSDGSVVLAVGLFLVFRSLTAFLATAFRAREAISREFALRTAESVLLVAIAGTAVLLGWPLPTLVWALTAAAGGALAAAIAGFLVFLPGFSWTLPSSFLRRMRQAAPYGLPAVAGAWLLRIDIVFLQKAGGDSERTAFFAAAANLVLVAGLVPAIASAAVYPALARRGSGRGMGRAVFLFFAGGAVLAAGVALAPQLLVRLAYGARYAGAARWTVALAPFLVFLAPGVFAATALAARGETFRLCVATLPPLAVQALADIALIPAHPGAVAGVTIAIEAMGALAATFFVMLSPPRSIRS